MKKKKFAQTKEIWGRLRKSKLAVVGLIIIVAMILIAIFADFIAPYKFDEQNLIDCFQGPSAAHWFGTDEFGRDIFSRVVYGTRISLLIGFVAVAIAMVIGVLLGAFSGYYGNRVDNIIMRLMDILLSIPQIILAIAIVAVLGNGLFNLMLAVGISSIPHYARIVRASVLSVKDQEFIEAAKAAGSSNFRIIFKHIIPNCLAPIIVQATLGVAMAILTAAGLSFVGLGISPPTPEWGSMLSSGRQYIRDYSYMTMFPGLAIMVTIFALNVLGDGLRDALDPKQKK
ncbi:MAG: ABC transporter permease [Eubacteriales bacterium]|nr:ABC transporter permease [Eubacteriales bacterium]